MFRSLLVLSRALYLPENLPAEDLIKSTLSVLPKSIEDATIAKVSELSGVQVDNKVKLELLKQEEKEIKLEKLESPVPSLKPEVVSPSAPEPDFAAQQAAKEKLVDKAEDLSPVDIKEINQIIESLPASEKIQVKAEIAELKKDVSEYKEDVREAEQLTSVDSLQAKMTETKSAKLLSKRVAKLIAEVDTLAKKIEAEAKSDDKQHPVSFFFL